MLFMIRRSFAELPASVVAGLYNTLVRPQLEYALQACSPNLVADADCLEQIQRLVMRLVKGFRRLPYEERLRRLGLHSLGRRRLRGDLIVVYKCFLQDWIWTSAFVFPPVRPGLRSQTFKVLQGHSRCHRRKSSFSTRPFTPLL